MPEFAAYAPHGHGGSPLAVTVRDLRAPDVPACAALAAARNSRPVADYLPVFAAGLDGDPERMVLVAEHAGRVAGYGRAGVLCPFTASGGTAPDGWYLTGVVVEPALRRRGIGRRLTTERLERLAAVTHVVHVVVASANRASIDLHIRLGFRCVTEDVAFPGVTFTSGTGMLLARGAPAAGPDGSLTPGKSARQNR